MEAAISIRAVMPNTIYRPEHKALVELIREVRRSAGLTQAEVSQKMGLSQSNVSDLERGTRRLDVIELRDLANICGTTLSDVVAELETRLTKKRASQTSKHI